MKSLMFLFKKNRIMRNHSNNLLPVIGIASIVIPLCCYLLILFSLPDVLMQKSFDRYMDKIGIDIPSVSCYRKSMNSLPGQEGIDIGNIFLKSGSIVIATFKEEDNPRKGFKFETIGTAEIADRLDKAAGWMAGTDELHMYPLRTFVDKDMPMKEVMSVLYRISPSRPRVAFVLRDRDTSGYIYFHYRIADSASTSEAYKNCPRFKRVEVSMYRQPDSWLVLYDDWAECVTDLSKVFENMLSSNKDNLVVVNTDGMIFEDCMSIVYEYARIVHKHRNDYCLKTYGKQYDDLDYPKLKEVHTLFPHNILLI